MSNPLDTVFAALADPTRRQILSMLLEDDMAITDVAEPFEMSLTGISKHLTILTRAGLITQERRGRVKWCKLEPDALRDASIWMQGFGQFEAVNLDSFERFLAQELENTAITDTAITGTAITDTVMTGQLPQPQVELIENAIIAPLSDEAQHTCGVFRANGSFCAPSSTLLSRGHFSGGPDHPEAEVDTLPGTHFYAGLGRRHFGHFLLESISRLWAMADLHQEIDSVLFLPVGENRMRNGLNGEYGALYRALAYDRPFDLITRPVRVQRLIVATQGFGHDGWITGTPEFRRFIRDRIAARFQPDGPEKLYISRRRLEGEEKLMDQEIRIEKLMRQAGYTAFHPQEHPIEDQAARYLAARQIVGGDGSAFHFAAFCLQPGAKVALIQRRDRPEIFRNFTDQMAAFCAAEVTAINPLIPMERRDTPEQMPAPLHFRYLRRQLHKAGFL